ncbi:MAG: hypothetical protein ACKVQC_00730 [Elusimicrobiota bacterium]
MKTVKTAISLPKEDFKQLEQIHKTTGKSRSEILTNAFHVWIESQKDHELENLYEQGYRQTPENLKDLTVFTKAGTSHWSKEDWK